MWKISYFEVSKSKNEYKILFHLLWMKQEIHGKNKEADLADSFFTWIS